MAAIEGPPGHKHVSFKESGVGLVTLFPDKKCIPHVEEKKSTWRLVRIFALSQHPSIGHQTMSIIFGKGLVVEGLLGLYVCVCVTHSGPPRPRCAGSGDASEGNPWSNTSCTTDIEPSTSANPDTLDTLWSFSMCMTPSKFLQGSDTVGKPCSHFCGHSSLGKHGQ